MSVATGTRLGPYEITGKLGEGGMGEVYRATDSRLRREVAIKVLPAGFTADLERVARFEREAQLLAQLQHPNIASIYGIEESDGVRALVMELVEGEDLSTRLARGSLPVDEALAVARQIAEALEAAHEQGIVHRDLKPQNVKLRADGTVKVLDFGLAKATSPPPSAESPAQLAHSPTLSIAATRLGVVLGSAGYMAPEQARGLEVDRRADVWAFGVVLFEMLTGRRLFAGDTTTDVIAAVMRQEIDWTLLPPDLAPPVRRLLARTLARDRRQRLRDIGDARLDLEEALAAPGSPERTAAAGRRSRSWAWPLLAVLGLVTAAGVLLWGLAGRRADGPAAAPMLLSVSLPTDVTLEATGNEGGPVAISPSGQRIAFSARRGAAPSQLWVRSLGEDDARPIAGTEGANHPFWSPDERALGFFSDLHLRTVAVDGGPVTTLASAPGARGGTWSPSGVILFSPNFIGPLLRVPAAGGTANPATEVASQLGDETHRYPSFLPDGRHFVYVARTRLERGIYVGELGTRASRLLVAGGANAACGGGHLLFARQGALMAQPLDLASLTLRESARVIVPRLLLDERFALGVFSSSTAGVLAYQSGREVRQTQLVWLDRAGKRTPAPSAAAAVSGADCPPVLSPDSRRALDCRTDAAGGSSLWEVDLERGTQRPLTHGKVDVFRPLWASDGGGALFGAKGPEAGPGAAIYARREGEDPRLLYRDDTAAEVFPTSLSPDGSLMLVERQAIGRPNSLLLLDLRGQAKVRPLFGGRSNYHEAAISPDGNWVAFSSDESGRYETYLARFPAGSGIVGVSTGGGQRAMWRRDGGELYYRDAENWLVAAEVIRDRSGEISIGRQSRLFQVVGDIDATADGQRFLVEEPFATGDVSPITIRTGWEKVGGAR